MFYVQNTPKLQLRESSKQYDIAQLLNVHYKGCKGSKHWNYRLTMEDVLVALP
jgi:hypothetical protein